MSTLMEDEIKHWTARRKSALVLEIIQGKTTVSEGSRAHDLPPSETEKWARTRNDRDDGWAVLALVIDCCTRELLGWHLSRSGRSRTAEAALEHALIARFGAPGRVPAPFLLRSDNVLRTEASNISSDRHPACPA